jgi:hypothetical protein
MVLGRPRYDRESHETGRGIMVKGSRMTPEQCGKLSLAHIGHKPWNKGKKTGLIPWNKDKPGKRGQEHPRWNGGKSTNGDGYIRITKPEHPAASKRGWIYEHRLVMEQAIGRPLNPNELVHHIDGDPKNNAPENLKIMLYGQHIRLNEAVNAGDARGDHCN